MPSFLLVLFCLTLAVSCSSIPKKNLDSSSYGVASWYGQEFHGRMTASGEKYDMHRLTCAHREYPFGTRLRVTNMNNALSVECIVNDRGPFVHGREIDLSYAAGQRIDLIGPGTARVRIDYMSRDTGYIRQVTDSSAAGPYSIQVGSFREENNARHLKAGLDLKYQGTYIMKALIREMSYYRVRIGKYASHGDARRIADLLAEEGYKAMIVPYEERI